MRESERAKASCRKTKEEERGYSGTAAGTGQPLASGWEAR